MARETARATEAMAKPVNAMRSKDYAAGRRDRRFGIYDKWYRYHRRDDRGAYDDGWQSIKRKDKWNKLTILEG